MFDRMELVPLSRGPGSPGELIALGGAHGPGDGAALVRGTGGRLTAVEAELTGLRGIDAGSIVAFLRFPPRRQAAAPPEAVVVPSSAGERLLFNGVPPFKLGVIGPGDILSVAGEDWLVARRLRAEPGPAPPEIASKSCPVCGMPLALAACVMHRCGAYMHLSRGSGGGEGDGDLDCYLRSSTCTACGGAIRPGDELIPDPAGARWSEDLVAEARP